MATVSHLEEHRAALTGHCYRMLGSAAEADDAVQETIVRAWRSLERFEERSSLRTWLYRIATHVCLDALADRSRRARPMELGPVGSVDDELTALPGSRWIEPIPDEVALPPDASPAERVVLRESIRLAFVAALQYLPPRQRAALLLAEVLGWSVAEIADSLDTSVAAINSALQRARATLAASNAGSDLGDDLGSAPRSGRAHLSDTQSTLLTRYVDAFERYDLDALTSLLREDATMSMPPYALWLRGHDSIRSWLLGRGAGCRGSRLVPTAACGSPAFGQYRPAGPGRYTPWALIVLELSGEPSLKPSGEPSLEPSGARIAAMNYFLDTEALFPRFGLPLELTR